MTRHPLVYKGKLRSNRCSRGVIIVIEDFKVPRQCKRHGSNIYTDKTGNRWPACTQHYKDFASY